MVLILTGHHQSKTEKALSSWFLINSSTFSTWHTGFSSSPSGLKWRRQGKQPILPSSSKLCRPGLRERDVERAHVAPSPNSRRLRAPTFWSIILKPRQRVRATTNPRSRLSRDRLHLLMGLVEGEGGCLRLKTLNVFTPQTCVACNAGYRAALSNSGKFTGTKMPEINQYYAIWQIWL